MSLFEKISVITERKYLPNDPSSNKSPIKRAFGKIFSNKARDIRQAPGDPLMGPPGLDYNDPNDLPSNKLGKPTYKNIPKGSLPKPSKPKAPIQLPPAKTSKTVKQSDVSKQAKEFTKDINKANVKRQETVAKRKYFRGRKAERLPGRSGEKPTGSIARGTYKSSPTGQRAYEYEKMKIDARDQKRARDKLDRKLDKSLKKGGKYPEGLQKALDKDKVKTPSQGIEKAAKDVVNRMKSGDKKARKQVMDLVDKDFKSKTPAKQKEYIKKFDKIQRAKGRTFNVKTGKYDPSPFEKSLRKAGASGDFSPTMPQDKRKAGQKKRDTRIKKLKTPDPFEVDTSKAAKQSAKTFGTPTKSQIKKLSKKPGGYRAPKGNFGKGLTPGEFRGKQMDLKAFKKTTTKDVLTDPKLSKQYGVKSFQKFSRDLQDFKDRDMPGGPRKTTTTKPKTSGVTLSRQDVGMAPPDTPRSKPKTNTVPKSKQQVKMSPDAYKKTFEYSSQTKFLNKKTGQPFNMANPGEKNEYLRQQGKKGFLDQKSNESKKTFKKMKKNLRGRDGNVTYNYTNRPPADKLTRGFKGQLGKRAFLGKAARLAGRNKGLTTGLAIAGLYGANELRKAIFPPKKAKTEKIRISPPINPKTQKAYKDFKSIKNKTEMDKNLMNVKRTYISKDELDAMGKGGRYNPTNTSNNLKKYSQSSAYKDTLRQIRVKTGRKNLDPYGVMGNKK